MKLIIFVCITLVMLPLAAYAGPAENAFVSRTFYQSEYAIESSQIILDQSDDQQIRDLAQIMIIDFDAINADLNQMISNKNIVIPDANLSKEHQDEFLELSKLTDQDLKKKYLYKQKLAHRRLIELFVSYLANGKDPELKAFSNKMLPALRKHYDRLNAADQQFNPTHTNKNVGIVPIKPAK